MRCPKCGFEQDEGPECLRCGVIFSRFRQPTEVLTERQLPLPPVSPAKPAPAPSAAGDPVSPLPPALPVPPVPPAPPILPISSEAGGGGNAPPDPVPPISLAGAGAEIFRVFFTFGPRLLLVAMLLDLLIAPLLHPLVRWSGLDPSPDTELLHNPIFRPVGILIVIIQYVYLGLQLSAAAHDRCVTLVRNAVLFYPFTLLVLGLLVPPLVLAWRGISWQDRLRRGLSSLPPFFGAVVGFHLLFLVSAALPLLLLQLLRNPAFLAYLFSNRRGPHFLLAVTALCLANGIRVGIKYGLAIPLAVLERDGVLTAFRRSATLTRGRRLRIAALLLLPLLAAGLEHEVDRWLIALHYQSAQHGHPAVRSLDWVFLVVSSLSVLFFAATVSVIVERLAGDPAPGQAPLAGSRLLPRAAALLLGAPVLFALAGFVLPYPSLSYYIARASMSGPDRLRFDKLRNGTPLPESAPGGEWRSLFKRSPDTDLVKNMTEYPAVSELPEHERRAIRALGRCLDAYRQRTRSGYPQDLSAVGPAGIGCVEREFAENRDPRLVIAYQPGKPDEHGQITTYHLDVGPTGPMAATASHMESDETSLLFFGANRNTGLVQPVVVIQWIDNELRRFRRDHPDEKYPRSLAELDRASDPNLLEIQRGLEAGRLDGYRYLYTPGPADSSGRTSTYRLDVRPVRYGADTQGSALCGPQGKLWGTTEDRAAEPTDSNREEGRPYYCRGEKGK